MKNTLENKFYVYAYLDPRKPGKYRYGKYSFDYEPFYIGKGCGDRFLKHLKREMKRAYNPYKDSKIRNIFKEGKSPIIIKVKESLLEDRAFEIEIELIKLIGMKKEGGPLTNLYEGGYGASKSQETRDKISATKKRQYASGEFIHPLLGTKMSDSTRSKIMKTKHDHPYKWTREQKKSLAKIRVLHKNISQTQNWKVIDPRGKETIVYGLGEFCRNNGLNQGHMFEVSTGKRSHHKKWRCEKITSCLRADQNIPNESL